MVSLYAQTQSASLDYNNTRVTVLNGGDFFWDLTSAKYEVPKSNDINDPKKHAIFSGAIWIGGEDVGGNLKLAAMTYRQRGQDFQPGPLSFDTASKSSFYDKIYKVSKSEIDAHISNSSNPINAILEWPGNGDTTKGEPYQLAPFVDVNKNGKYEPTLGDYPKIKGIGAAYCVYNDNTLHTESNGQPANVEIHQMFYQDEFNYNGNLIDDVNLASFKVINRGAQALYKFKFGVYMDFDLGYFADDYVGSDSATNMIYAYNGDSLDESITGYGLNPPAQNMMFLNKTMDAAIYYNNNSNPINGNPNQASDYYNYLCAKWKGGQDVSYGGDGVTSGPGKTKYMFSGDPATNSGWTEAQSGNTPADRRMLAVSYDALFEPGEILCYDIAFVYGRATNDGPTASITEMRNKAAIVQSVYNNDTYGWKTNCKLGAQDEGETGSLFNREKKAMFTVYPNPSTGLFHIEYQDKLTESIIITDALGQVVMELGPNTHTFNLNDLANGVYFLSSELGSMKLLKH